MAGGTTSKAGDVITPGENSPDWQNARLLLAKDTSGNYRVVGVDAGGRLLTDAELTVGDIQIGAVELKDHNSDIRADILLAGGLNSLAVTSGTLATQATLAAVQAALGPLATQATLAAVQAALGPLATQATLAAVQTLITNYRAVIAAAAPTDVVQVGGQVQTGVPAAAANNALVPLNVDAYRRLLLAGYNPAQASLDVSQVSAAKIPALIETGWTALSAAGTFTPQRDVRDYATHTIIWITSGLAGGESMDIIVWGSINGTNWIPLHTHTISDADETDGVYIQAQVTYIKCEQDALTGAASVIFQLTSGNLA